MPAFRWSFEVYNLSALGFSCCTMAMQGNHSAGKSQILLKFCREFPMHGVNKLSLCSLPSQLFPHFQSRTRRINQPTDHGPAKMLINSEWGHCPPLPAPPCILIRPCKLTGAKHKHGHFLFHVCFSVLHFFFIFYYLLFMWSNWNVAFTYFIFSKPQGNTISGTTFCVPVIYLLPCLVNCINPALLKRFKMQHLVMQSSVSQQ